MTAVELLELVRRQDIHLEVQGGRLIIDAPAGAVTSELKAALGRHKPALIALLEPITEYVTLKGGLVLPLPALRLFWSLEDRGFHLTVDADQTFVLTPTERLTDADRAGIYRWWRHLAAIVSYACPPEELPQ